jgi:hypothetical protein
MQRRSIIAIAVAAVVFALQLLAFHELRHDDAYITYRYGQNLASGNGLVFNPGERTMGSTSPAFSLLSGFAYAVGGKDALPSIMASVGCLAWSAQALALFFMLRRALGDLFSSAVSLAIAAGAAGSAQWVALETNAAVALTLWAIVLAQRERWSWAAGTVALAGLVRPDALLVAVLIAVLAGGRLRSAIWKPAAVFVGVNLPWLVFATVYFGSPLPQSAVAKFQRVPFAEYLLHALRTPAEAFLPFEASLPAIVASWLIALAGAAYLVGKGRGMWILPAYGAAHLAAYCYLRPFTQHTWHLYPATLVVAVLGLCGIAAIASATRYRTVRVAASAVLVLLVCGYAYRTRATALEFPLDYWTGARDAAYRKTAEFLLTQTRPGDVIASEEVGTLGYLTELPMYDLGGLITTDPSLKSHVPGLRWFVANRNFLSRPRDTHPTRTFDVAGFTVFVFRLDAKARGVGGRRERPQHVPRPQRAH